MTMRERVESDERGAVRGAEGVEDLIVAMLAPRDVHRKKNEAKMDAMMKRREASYVLRAECPTDADKLREALGAAGVSVKHWRVEPDEPPFPDVKVSFSTDEPAAVLRAVLEAVEDGHVMRETFAPADLYDGVRTGLSSVCFSSSSSGR
jgi:hypothetical protein